MRDRQLVHEFGAQLFVRREPAGRQDHAAPRADGLALVADIDHGAFDAVVSLHQLDQPRIERDRDVAGAQAVEQPRDQRVAHHQPRAAPVAQPIGRVAQQQLRGRREGLQRSERLQQDRDVVLADHHAAEHHERRDRRPHAREILAEQSRVERQRRERAAGERAAGLVRVIVRMARRRAELHLAARLQIVERGRAGFEKGFALSERPRADLGFEKAPRVVDRIRHAVALRLAGAGNPHACRRRSTSCRRPDRSSRTAGHRDLRARRSGRRTCRPCRRRTPEHRPRGPSASRNQLAGPPAGENSVTSFPLGAA